MSSVRSSLTWTLSSARTPPRLRAPTHVGGAALTLRAAQPRSSSSKRRIPRTSGQKQYC